MLEKQIEKNVCDYARSKGCLVYKFTSPQRAAVPDRLFITPEGRHFFIEFKRSGQNPTPAQEREHERLRNHKALVHVIDNVFYGITVIDEMMVIR